MYCISPSMKKLPEAWYCSKCALLNSKACTICENSDDDHKMLLCDGCDEGFHLHCLEPPLDKVPKLPHWFCDGCKLTDEEVIKCKVLIGFKELVVEVRRLFRKECEQMGQIHAANVAGGCKPEDVISQLRELTSQLGQKKLELMKNANTAFQDWESRLNFT